MHDLVIRNGTIVDGSGQPRFEADLAIDGDRITAIGSDLGPGEREIDAGGKLVTPGWVDIHTHYDGQATWDPHLTPSGWNGVTTVVMGNCGVGFAPAKPHRREWLIQLMEGVEDIPGSALSEGMSWDWESFPEYLDALERFPRSVDVAALVPHGAVRAYVMEERGAKNEKATPEDIEAMAGIVKEALEAGAMGFSTSRTLLHRAKDGEPVPGTFASEDELLGIGKVLGEVGSGVFELASDINDEKSEISWMDRLSRSTGRPVTFACLQNDMNPTQWSRLLEACEESAANGGRVVPQVAQRPAGILMGFQSSLHPFVAHEGYQAIRELPLAERVEKMREPAVRAAILDNPPDIGNPVMSFVMGAFHKLFPLGDELDYEPTADTSVAAVAEREGKRPHEVAYDMLLEDEGKALLYMPFLGYSDGNFEALREMMVHPLSVFGLSDGGAHCGIIADASMPTYLLTYWVRDRKRGERLGLEDMVRAQTRSTAELYELADRGILAVGMKADVNVIDLENLRIHSPEMVHDLPKNAPRLIQQIDGYDYTICAGQVTYEHGKPTGALPGRVLRGPQAEPGA